MKSNYHDFNILSLILLNETFIRNIHLYINNEYANRFSYRNGFCLFFADFYGDSSVYAVIEIQLNYEKNIFFFIYILKKKNNNKMKIIKGCIFVSIQVQKSHLICFCSKIHPPTSITNQKNEEIVSTLFLPKKKSGIFINYVKFEFSSKMFA